MPDNRSDQTPGRHTRTIPVTRLGNGHSLELTVHEVVGAQPGPTLLLFGGVHGDEAMGVEEVRRIVTGLDPEQLSGVVRAVPVANPYAYNAMSRFTPDDGLNLNRIVPGTRTGGALTELLAATLSEIILEADFFIDFHSSGLYSTVDYAYQMAGRPDVSAAFGCKLLYEHMPFEGSTAEWAIRHGIPAFTSELGGGGQLTGHYLDAAVAGTANVMRALKMLPGEVAAGPTEQWVMHDMTTLRPTTGGTLISSFTPDRLGETVPGGTVMGKMIDPFTYEVLEELVAPYESNFVVLAREEFTRAVPGDYGFMVGDVATSTKLVLT